MLVSYVGFKELLIPVKNVSGRLSAAMIPSIQNLEEIKIKAQKLKTITVGKSKNRGLVLCFYNDMPSGTGIAYKIKAKKNANNFLSKVGFVADPLSNDSFDKLVFRINIYSIENHGIVNVTKKPIIFTCTPKDIRNNKFEYTLDEYIKLPDNAMVEFELVEDMGKQGIAFRGSGLGSKKMIRYLSKNKWDEMPLSMPFFIEYAQVKQAD